MTPVYSRPKPPKKHVVSAHHDSPPRTITVCNDFFPVRQVICTVCGFLLFPVSAEFLIDRETRLTHFTPQRSVCIGIGIGLFGVIGFANMGMCV